MLLVTFYIKSISFLMCIQRPCFFILSCQNIFTVFGLSIQQEITFFNDQDYSTFVTFKV